ncbi:Golgi CORVET complex core vacuolar protein 8-domain-containing protein [Rhizophagus irregularis DAOM 181602=DAOM 197198]|uniref:Golgi CORVET complex core vacuolar protein 8-domain-containing protein n=1 Tax=Rhizophagus irregularis (strain DAOM 181602 / DAOM 197198 / MUCL 43194) TaxID=747089 RepID=A0A2P4Q050_RHIID|nr:Golgi CORVET complex core vacuolar protein 8-domain-containing protein [Rhizophagus irregularis DAOM 181602=DAOM 197198]POG71025.1 Golgi CORVET complex core vacuolar protein 8-domain-containing protein [Rhizophagus irregularis DAOM 181602=DAOM 197198]|eukprot:XP_025177891.1 Golgi CORVET complex core vacuolar protein 8-domain-containing protein [Rhizophagus irregularis DAOM 181602=DAOM 197198]
MTPTAPETETYDDLIKRILESDTDDDFSKHPLSSNSAPEGPLPPELEAALEDNVQAEKYLSNLKKRMEAWKAAGLTDAMKRALELLHENNGLTSGNSEEDEDTDGSSNDEPATPTIDIHDIQPQPKVAEGSISRLVNGVSSLVDIENSFNKLRIPELDLPITQDSTIKSALTELYKLQEDLQIHLQGGPLADPSTMGAQRRKKVADLLERVMKEAALYEEFVNKAQHLSLDRILNESEGSSDEECIDSETIDTESEIPGFEDSLSDISRRSAATPSTTPLSPRSLRALDPSLARLRSTSSASIPSMQSRASSRLSRSSSPSILGLEDLGLLAPPEPWEAFRWSPMAKLSEQLYSNQHAGLATVLAVSGVIAVGTIRGLIMVYDFSQTLKCVLGTTVNAFEQHGAVTSLAISSDHTQIVSGHAQGFILIWDLQRPMNPVRSISPISPAVAAGGRKEGHIRGSSILHVGFVGMRKNGIVSGDDHGMAFYHNLYKVMLVNATETTRILGSYPTQTSASQASVPSKPRRPSTVFGLSPLPLGQTPHGSESFGLVAMLTPYKMIIVSTKPTPQTQYKYLKPKNVSTDSSTSKSIAGCLAWFPADKFQLNDDSPTEYTDPLLAFSWGHHLTILKVTAVPLSAAELSKKRRRPEHDVRLEFTRVGDWKSRNGIVALQWLSSQILLILTNTEDIVVFDPKSLHDFEQSNIRQRSLVYHDRFSSLLKDITDDSNVHVDTSRTTVDLAYYHSIRVYKGNVFLLGVRQLHAGTLLSWADRVVALVQSGDFLEAIALATSFYNKTSSQTILGLPDDEESRHAIVGEKLMELLIGSINYAFSSERTFQGMVDEHNGSGAVLFNDLAVACIEACLSMHREDFLFNDVYERYSEASAKGVLLEVFEPYILEDKIKDLPPEIMKDLVDHYKSRRMLAKVEKCIWHINPQCIDIDQVVQLCQSEGLYDAMIYVWNRSMMDYVSPAVELLKIIRKILILEKRKKKKHRSSMSTSSISADVNVEAGEDLETMRTNARKFYTYMGNILTGRTYPNGAPLSEPEANEARTTLYSFVFSGRCVVWPRHGGELILTAEDELKGSEPTYPYLRIFLRFDTKAFLQALEIAFEDSYLNGVEIIMNGDEYVEEEELPGKIINRQLLVNILLEVMTSSSYDNSEFSQTDISYLYSFVARNLPKYTQFLLLPPSIIHKILVHLSTDNVPRTREERQLSVECLLSIYTPQDENQMVQLYENAGFWRVLEHVYKADKKYGLLVTTYLKDPERRNEVFDCIRSLLNPNSKLTEKQREEVTQTIMTRIDEIVDIDGEQTAAIIKTYFDSDHKTVIENLSSSPARLFTYLRGLLEPSQENITGGELVRVRTVEEQVIMSEAHSESLLIDPEIHEQYIALMCRFDPTGVYHYLQTHPDTYRMEYVLPICDDTDIVDAVVWILERSGKAVEALNKILDIVQDKKQEILSLIEDKKNDINDQWTLIEKTKIETSLMKLKGVLKIGILLCENSCRRATSTKGSKGAVALPQDHTTESETELLWFKLLDAFLDATKAISSCVIPPIPPMMSEKLLANGQLSSFEVSRSPISPYIANHLVTTFKSYVQSIMRSLLLSTSSPYVSLPRLLLRFIQSQAKRNSTVSDFRDIFVGMIDTYKYEGQLLAMTNRLFEKDLFMNVAGVVRQRGKGWRPRRGACEVCGVQFWGTDLNHLNLRTPSGWGSPEKKTPHSSTISNPANIADALPDALPTLELLEEESNQYLSDGEASTSVNPLPSPPSPQPSTSSTIQENDLLLFRCGHGYHRRCLETESNISTENEPETICTVCQIERRSDDIDLMNNSTGRIKGKDKII